MRHCWRHALQCRMLAAVVVVAEHDGQRGTVVIPSAGKGCLARQPFYQFSLTSFVPGGFVEPVPYPLG